MNKEEQGKYVRGLAWRQSSTERFRHRRKTCCQPYSSDGDARGNYHSSLFVSDVLPEIKEYITGNVLDVGCGNGRLSHIMSKYATKVHGIDPYAEQLDKFKNEKITYESVGLGDFSTLDKYDCIFSCGVFFLLHDPTDTFTLSYPDQREYHLEMLEKCKGMLSDNGIIIVIDEHMRKVDHEENGSPLLNDDNPYWWGRYNLDGMCNKLNLKNIKEFSGMVSHRISVIKYEK